LQISEQILDYLNQNKIFLFEKYRKWLSKDGKDYQLLTLSDKSVWTFRLGENLERYVHIHPGRYSTHTIRVKATTLKTAILILYCEKIGLIKSIETQTVNQIREIHLDEPPLKSFSSASGLRRLLDLFHKKA
jgi:hypothetical protein